jgi:hypothetical protein
MAPAGCGKTQLIADTLQVHAQSKPILVLTHTNAGVSALKGRLQRAEITSSAYRVMTIDGFAIRLASKFPLRSGHDPTILALDQPSRDYPAIRSAAANLLHAGHINDPLRATYSRLIVDEYQDCCLRQHAIIDEAATTLPTCVLGDPMQAIFGLGGTNLVDWATNVHSQFPPVGELHTPWRWRNAGTENLGIWLLAARNELAAGRPVNLRHAPQEVTWVQLTPATAVQQRMVAARTQAPTRPGSVLVIGDSRNAQGRHQVASQTPGATIVEPVDLRDLTDFARRFDVSSPDALSTLIGFAGEMMTGVGAAALLRRVQSLRRGTAINPATSAEAAAVTFSVEQSFRTALTMLAGISEQADVRVYRPEVLRCCMSALRAAADGSCSFQAAAVRAREQNRHFSRQLSRRSIGSTLLLKGLEADVAVVLHPETMDAKHLYVALTRAAQRIVVCSETSLLTPVRQR